MKYSHVFVAGTFDGIHKGHESLLMRAFSKGRKVIIGLTSDEFVKKFKTQKSPPKADQPMAEKFKTEIQNSKLSSRLIVLHSYTIRKNALTQWLHDKKFLNRSDIIPIDDPYEPAASMKNLDGLIVTEQNRNRGEHINGLRQGLSLSPLALIEVSMVAAGDGKPISSTRIRNGEIDRRGRLIMPEFMREVLSKPLGRLLVGQHIDVSIHRYTRNIIITVGDVATKTVLDAGIVPLLAIIDGKVGRKPFTESLDQLRLLQKHQPQKVGPFKAAVVSGPGFISEKAIEAIKQWGEHVHSMVLIIDGEEDLLALPVIHYAPIGSVVYYGQPARNASPARKAALNAAGGHSVARRHAFGKADGGQAGGPGEGLVKVIVTGKIKEKVAKLLSQFV